MSMNNLSSVLYYQSIVNEWFISMIKTHCHCHYYYHYHHHWIAQCIIDHWPLIMNHKLPSQTIHQKTWYHRIINHESSSWVMSQKSWIIKHTMNLQDVTYPNQPIQTVDDLSFLKLKTQLPETQTLANGPVRWHGPVLFRQPRCDDV